MAEEILVKESLSAEMIASGEEMTKRLVEAGWGVAAAFWLYFTDSLRWNLVFGINEVLEKGSIGIYSKIQDDLAVRPICGINFLDIVILQSDHPLVKRMKNLAKTNGNSSPSRVTHIVMDNVFIEDALIYPVPRRRRNAA